MKIFESTSETKDGYIRTVDKIKFFPYNRKLNQYRINDIATGLSNICRYNGQLDEFYSVAEHSVYVMQWVKKNHLIANKNLLLMALLHDAPEAYLGDVPRPYKHSRAWRHYVKLENKICRDIFDYFGVEYEDSWWRRFRSKDPCDPIIKQGDMAIFDWEYYSFRPEFYNGNGFTHKIVPMQPNAAKRFFLNAYQTITQ